MELQLVKTGVNTDALSEALRDGTGGLCSGIAVQGNVVRVFLADGVEPAVVVKVMEIVDKHDPAVLSKGQQSEIVRVQVLEKARREAKDVQLDLEKPNVGDLVKLVTWLAAEVEDLRQRLNGT